MNCEPEHCNSLLHWEVARVLEYSNLRVSDFLVRPPCLKDIGLNYVPVAVAVNADTY